MATRGGLVVKKGQNLMDIVQALSGAEEDLSGRENLPPRQPYVTPDDVDLPDFNSIYQSMSRGEGSYWEPGMHYDPNASKGKKVMQAISSMLSTIDPEMSRMMMTRNRFIQAQKKQDFNNAINLYRGKLNASRLSQQQIDAKVRVMNQAVSDFNKHLDRISAHPKAWDVLKEAISMMTGMRNAEGKASERSRASDDRTLKYTNNFIGKTIPDALSYNTMSLKDPFGKAIKKQFDPDNPKERLEIAKRLNSSGFKARVDVSGADPVAVWKYLRGEYPDLIPDTPDAYYGDSVSLAPPMAGGTSAPKTPTKGSAQGAALDLNDKTLLPGAGEVGDSYIKRLQQHYGGDKNKAFAHWMMQKFEGRMASDAEKRSVVGNPTVQKHMTNEGVEPQKVLEYLMAPEPEEETGDEGDTESGEEQ